MAQVIKPVQSTMFSIATEPNFSARRPQTPPYTPSRSKIRFERNDSPAPSIHPTETISPEKPTPSKRAEADDSVLVRELNESELASLPSVDFVYPKEMEEESDRAAHSDSEDGGGSNDDATSDADVGTSEAGIARKFARMQCDDDSEEARMQRSRRKRRNGKRAGQRLYKRSHSISIDSDSEVTDVDAMDDHDLSRSARRLRRKVEEDLHTDDDDTAARKPGSRSHRGDVDGSPSTRAQNRYSARALDSTARHRAPSSGQSIDDQMELSE